MRFRFLQFALFIVCFPVAAQDNDTLLREYQQAMLGKDYVRAGIHLSDVAKYYYQRGNYDSAKQYYTRALKINKQVKNDTMIASNFLDVGSLYERLNVSDSALAYYEMAIRLYEKIGNQKGYAYTKINMSAIFKDKGLYERALEYALSAEAILAKDPDDHYLDNCYNAIGSIYNRIEDYSKSLTYYKKALRIRQKRGEVSEVASTLNNMGNVYMNTNSYDNALLYYNQSLEIKRTLPNKRSLSTTLNNLGEILLKLSQPEKAEVQFLESLTIKRSVDDKLGQAVTLNNLADCKLRRAEYRQAEAYLDQGEEMERAAGGSLAEKKKNLELRVALNRAIKNYHQASDFAQALAVVKDSLLGTEKSEALANIQARYETESKEQQIEILHTEQKLNEAAIEARNFWIAALCIAIVSALVIALLSYYSFRAARRGRQRVEFLMKELHHRVKNNLQVLSSVLSLQSQHLTDENTLLSVKSTEGRINAMALIHRKLYSDERNTIVSTRGYFRELIDFLMSSYGYNQRNLNLHTDIDEVELDVDKAIPLGLIVNELLSNAFKHAFTLQDNPSLSIVIKLQGHELHVVIRDNGRGTAAQPGEEAKFGMRMVNILINDLRGKFHSPLVDGTEHRVTIPLT